MGMSSSQARLLNLTSRMHQIEYKATKLEAEKLQMANESSRVYNEYLEALEATKVQYQVLSTDGAVTYRDASIAILENGFVPGYTGEASKNVLFLQNQAGQMIVTEAIKNAYGLSDAPYTGSLDDYLINVCGETKDVRVKSFDKIPNTRTASNDNRVYAPVANGTTALKPVVDAKIAAGQASLVISSAADLQAFLNSADCANKDVVLTADIDMTGVSYNKMTNYYGNFNGNGHTISGLTNTMFETINGGSFTNTNLVGNIANGRAILATNVVNSTVENVSASGSVFYNQDASGNKHAMGGLIAQVDNSTVNQCSFSGSVETNGISAGGIFGNIINNSHVTNCSAAGTVTADLFGGGFVSLIQDSTVEHCSTSVAVTINNKDTDYVSDGGVSRAAHPDSGAFASSVRTSNASRSTVVKNCIATGSVNVDGLVGPDSTTAGVGGFAGVITGQNVSFNNCETSATITIDDEGNTSNVSIGGFAAYANDTSSITINNCDVKVTEPGVSNAAYSFYAGQLAGANISGTGNYSSLSTVNGLDYSAVNPLAVAVNHTTPNNNNTSVAPVSLVNNGTPATPENYTVSQYLTGSAVQVSSDGVKSNINAAMGKAFSTADSAQVDALVGSLNANQLASLNIALCNYLTTNHGSVAAAQNDAFVVALEKALTTGNKASLSAYLNSCNSDICTVVADGATCGQTGTFDKAVVTVPSNNDLAKEIFYALENKFGKDNSPYDLATITATVAGLSNLKKAVLNDEINAGKNIETILTNVMTNPAYGNNSQYANTTFWSVKQATTDAGVNVEYEEYWNTAKEGVRNGMAAYSMAKKGVVVVTDEQANSSNYLVNLLNSGDAVLTTFNPNGVAEEGMTEEEYNTAMGIRNTSVSIETCLQEVPNTIALKKAEAKYEADMLKIDRKDRKYDYDLAALDTERNAIKQEMETLKTVAKENVERTFKLFG